MKKIAFFMCCLCAVMFMSCTTNTTGTENGHEWVDLGLPSGTKWATCNVGASKPEDYGNYYAWGETETKRYYDAFCKWESFYFDAEYGRWMRYGDTYGAIEGKGTLEPGDDAARANWGGQWRMPTDEEWQELIEHCTWHWVSKVWHEVEGYNGYGYEVEGPNGNTIFLPAAGNRGDGGIDGSDEDDYTPDDDLGIAKVNGNYWSSSLDTERGAGSVYFSEGHAVYFGHDYRHYRGQSVRPVFK
ncbi:MAG: hypothetical protein ACI392_01745 [Paludibacteraceae bacterium]